MLESIEKVLTEERPDWVIVYGGTNSKLAGALGATKLHISVEPIATIILIALSELPVEKHDPYGNSRAAERIVQDLIGGDPTFKETSQAEPPNSVPVRTP